MGGAQGCCRNALQGTPHDSLPKEILERIGPEEVVGSRSRQSSMMDTKEYRHSPWLDGGGEAKDRLAFAFNRFEDLVSDTY